MGGFGTPSHSKKHPVNSLKNHKPVPGATGGNIVVIDPVTKLPTKDSLTSLSSILGGLIPQGIWNAATNTPMLADGTGTLGHFYIVGTAGSQDLGSGVQDFEINDWVMYDQLNEWKRVENSEPNETEQAIGYYVSQTRGKTASLGADGSLFNPFDDIPEAILKGIANGDTDIIIFIDTRAGANYPNLVLPDGQHINLIGSEPLWSDATAIDLITNGNGTILNADGLALNQIREGPTLGGAIRLEECVIAYIKNNAGTGFATNTDGYFNNTQYAIPSLLTDINGMKTQQGTLICSTPGSYGLITLDGINANSNKIENLTNGTIATDSMALGQRYTDTEALAQAVIQTAFANQSNVYRVSDLKGLNTNDGSEFKPLKTPLKAIQLGIIAGFPEIYIKLDMSGGTYAAFTIPDGAININMSSWGGLFSMGVIIGDITVGDGTTLILDDIMGELIKEGIGWTTESADVYIENSMFEGIKKNDGITPATRITAVTKGAIDAGSFVLDLKAIDASGIGWDGDITDGSGRFVSSDGFDANDKKVINQADGVLPTDGMNLSQRYTDGEAGTVADGKIATHAAIIAAHHAKYLDSEAVTAMGAKGDGNPLNHDRPIQATESIVGIGEIATQPETDAGTDDEKFITPKKLAAYTLSAIPTVIQGSEDAENTTTSTSYQQAYRFSPTLEIAKYKVEISCEITNNSDGKSVEARVEIDDTTEILHAIKYVKQDSVDVYDVRSAIFYYDCLSAAVHNFDFDFRQQGGGTAKIRRKRIILTKVVE